MKRSIAIAAVLLIAAVAGAAQQTLIKKGLPALTVMLVKNEMYSVDDFNANIARIEKAWIAQMNPQLGDAEREKAKIEIMAAVKPKFLDALIGSIIFRQFCEREGVTISEADVSSYIARLKAQLGASAESDAALEQALTVSQGIVFDLKTFARQRLLLKKYIQTKKVDELKALKGPTPDEILEAYEQMRPNLVMPETARVSLLFIDYAGKSADERKKAGETMRALASQVKDDKSSFDKLLLGSFGQSAGYMAKPSYMVVNVKDAPNGPDPKFIEAVFKLEAGEISGLLENAEGLQIVRVNERSPSKQLALYDTFPGQANVSVQDLIVEQLAGLAQEAYAAKFQVDTMERLRGEATVTIMKDNLRGVIGDAELDSIASRYSKKKK